MSDYRLPYDEGIDPEEPQQVYLPGFSRVLVVPSITHSPSGARHEVGVMLLGTDSNQGDHVVYLHGYLGMSPDQARTVANELLDQADWAEQQAAVRVA